VPDGSTDTFTYTNGVLTNETQVHAAKSKDVFLSGITGKTYIAEHDVYNTSGVKLLADQTLTDGTHSQVAYAANAVLTSTLGITDLLQAAAVGGDSFVFRSGFGRDKIAGFHPGSDTIKMDHALFSSVADLLAHTADLYSNGGLTGALISDAIGDTLLVQGVSAAQLTTYQDHLLLI
jgi:hypothetical protein